MEWLEKKSDTSPDIQNKILKLMLHKILKILHMQNNIQQADYFMIMVDECVNVSNKEQVVSCFRHVSPDFKVQACIAAQILLPIL